MAKSITKGELKKMIQEEIARAQKMKTLQESIAAQTKLLKEMEGDMAPKEINEMVGPEAIQAMGDVAVALTFALPFIGTGLYAWYTSHKDKADAKLKDIGKKVKAGDIKGASAEAKGLGAEVKADKPVAEQKSMNEMVGPEAIQAMGDVAVALTFALPFIGTGLYAWYENNKAKAEAKLKDIAKKVKANDIKGASMEAKALAAEAKAEKAA